MEPELDQSRASFGMRPHTSSDSFDKDILLPSPLLQNHHLTAAMQSTRFLAANMLRAQSAPTSMLRSRAVPMLRMQPARGFKSTPKRMEVPVC